MLAPTPGKSWYPGDGGKGSRWLSMTRTWTTSSCILHVQNITRKSLWWPFINCVPVMGGVEGHTVSGYPADGYPACFNFVPDRRRDSEPSWCKRAARISSSWPADTVTYCYICCWIPFSYVYKHVICYVNMFYIYVFVVPRLILWLTMRII